MTKREFERRHQLLRTLQALGFTFDEAESLRRISNTLRRWYEAECNGTIQRGDDGVARGYRVNARFLDPQDPRYWYRVADREAGAKKRLAAIMTARNTRIGRDKVPGTPGSKYFEWAVYEYIQTDPRGAALYIIRPGDVPAGKDADAYYSNGICVY